MMSYHLFLYHCHHPTPMVSDVATGEQTVKQYCGFSVYLNIAYCISCTQYCVLHYNPWPCISSTCTCMLYAMFGQTENLQCIYSMTPYSTGLAFLHVPSGIAIDKYPHRDMKDVLCMHMNGNGIVLQPPLHMHTVHCCK